MSAPKPETVELAQKIAARIEACAPDDFPDDFMRYAPGFIAYGLSLAHESGRREGLGEAEALAKNPYGDQVDARGSDEPLAVGGKIARAVRARWCKGRGRR